MKLIVMLLFTVVLGFMGWSLYLLVADTGKSKSLVRTLTVRVALSLLLFLVLYVGWYFGLIKPNTVT